MNDKKQLAADAKRWVEQEKVWDDALYASGVAIKRVGVSAKKPDTAPNRPPAEPPRAPAPVTPARTPAPSPEKAAALKALYEQYKDCTRCRLGSSRIKFVFGVGNPSAEILFIGEGPGYEEDRRGEPFVGKSGQLLDKMMAAIGLSRQTNAYIANIVKCHPMTNPETPEARNNDRAPSPDEVETCAPILLQQIKIMKPRVIMTLGSPSTKMILKTKDGITGLRGRYFPFAVDEHYPLIGGVPLMAEERAALAKVQVLPTYHPAALLRNPNLKPESWSDLKLLAKTLSQP